MYEARLRRHVPAHLDCDYDFLLEKHEQMKKAAMERRVRRVWAGIAFGSVVLGFIACSGSTDRKTARGRGDGGEGQGGSAAAGAPSVDAGGSSAQAGKTSTGGMPAVMAGAGGEPSVSGGGAGEGGLGGQPTSGGEAGSGGEVSGGAGGLGGAGGEGGQAPHVDPICGVNLVQVGAFSLWCGKVNMHTDAQGAWLPDADCSSGCNIAGVGYCNKYYPTASTVVALDQTKSVVKDWKNAGFTSGAGSACNDSVGDGPGISGEFACCAPAP
jgi:hypothetical protein